jgi:hypothetical protein
MITDHLRVEEEHLIVFHYFCRSTFVTLLSTRIQLASRSFLRLNTPRKCRAASGGDRRYHLLDASLSPRSVPKLSAKETVGILLELCVDQF